MKITGKPVMFGAPILAVITLFAVMGLWAWGAIGSESLQTAKVSYTGTVDWEHRDSSGVLLAGGTIHNDLGDSALDVIYDSIINDAATAAFKQIAASSSSGDGPGDGIAGAALVLTLDGDVGGAAGDQNPATGTIDTPVDNSGSGTVEVTFKAGASVNILQILLVNAAVQDTLSTQNAIAEDEVLAFVDVPDVALAVNDTVKYTWTINFD